MSGDISDTLRYKSTWAEVKMLKVILTGRSTWLKGRMEMGGVGKPCPAFVCSSYSPPDFPWVFLRPVQCVLAYVKYL